MDIEKRNAVEYKPGDIVYADSNGKSSEDYFGLVVDRNFWLKEIEKENVILYEIERYRKNGVLDNMLGLRVLGDKFFRQSWKTNDPNRFEPGDNAVMNYRVASPIYTCKINLRPTLELCSIDGNRVGGLLLGDANDYVHSALGDARTVYDYLDGERFDASKKYIYGREKLLRLLEQAVPLD